MYNDSSGPRRRSPNLLLFALIIVVVLVATVAFDANSPLRLWMRGAEAGQEPVAIAQVVQPTNLVVNVDPATVERMEVDHETALLMDVYARGNPSVVQVQEFAVGSGLLGAVSEGSGFVWDTEGHIVTNAHVVGNLDSMHVTFYDDTVSVGEVVGVDPDSDLAVIRIDPAGYDLRPVALGRSEDLHVGMRVAAIGSPFSQTQTMTSGIVSALGRTMTGLTNYRIPDSIQFDAAINPGNSGGPLFNDRVELVGVVSQIISPQRVSSGIGLAVPISIVRRVVPSLIETGRYEHSYLGVSGTTFSPICASALDLPQEVRGAYIIGVMSDTPASRGGLRGGRTRADQTGEYPAQLCPELKGGDLITAIEAQAVGSFDDLMVYLERYTSPGDQVTLTVLRGGSPFNLEIELSARPETS